jgi:hypothetical protein
MPIRGVLAVFMAVMVFFMAIWAKNLQIVIRVVPMISVSMVDLQDAGDLVKPTPVASIFKVLKGGFPLLFSQPDAAFPLFCLGPGGHPALKKPSLFKPADSIGAVPRCPQLPD